MLFNKKFVLIYVVAHLESGLTDRLVYFQGGFEHKDYSPLGQEKLTIDLDRPVDLIAQNSLIIEQDQLDVVAALEA